MPAITAAQNQLASGTYQSQTIRLTKFVVIKSRFLWPYSHGR
ncbi:MAG TPA: hypothetical protein VFI84_03370 [Candidatus Saccharimonadales bacterium]|nr:hypothetical protein [Candidatus Saccharimonadales bacterium]